MESLRYSTVALKSLVGERSVENLADIGEFITNFPSRQAGHPMHHSGVGPLSGIDGPSDQAGQPKSPDVRRFPGLGGVGSLSGSWQGSETRSNDSDSLMHGGDAEPCRNFLLKPNKNLKNCMNGVVCTRRQHTPMSLCIDEPTTQISFIDLPSQHYEPYNPACDSRCVPVTADESLTLSEVAEFGQKTHVSKRNGDFIQTFQYPRTSILDMPDVVLPEFPHMVGSGVHAVGQYFGDNRRKCKVLNREEKFCVLREMFQDFIVERRSNDLLCLVVQKDAPPRFQTFDFKRCVRCWKVRPVYDSHWDCYALPLSDFCECGRTLQPVVVSTQCSHWLLLNFCRSFQMLNMDEKMKVLSYFGPHVDIHSCGQMGALHVKRIGANLSLRQQIYVSFLMNGLSPFVFSQKSLSEFAVMVAHIGRRMLCKPHLFFNEFPFYELIASCMRLNSSLPLSRAWFDFSEDGDFQTDLVILGKQLLDHGVVGRYNLTQRRRDEHIQGKLEQIAEGVEEVCQAGLLNELSKTAYDMARLDVTMSWVLKDIFHSETLWTWINDLTHKMFPDMLEHTAAFKDAVMFLALHYLENQEFSASFHVANAAYKRNMWLDEIVIYDAMHALLYLGYKLTQLWMGKASEFIEGEVPESGLFELKHFFTCFLPFGTRCLVKEMIEELRLYSLLRTFTLDIFGAIQAIITWLVGFIKKNVMCMKDEYEQYISEVDSLQEVFLKEDGTSTSLRHEMVRDAQLRDKVMALLTLGTQLKRKLEKNKAPKDLLKQVSDRCTKVNRIVSGSSATFVGAEGKIKPFTVYLYGEPGSGKSVMLPHLFHDICYALGAAPFDKTRDMYVMTAKTGYHDQYAYQRFAIRNDVLQMKDDEQRVNEIYDLINMADETPYPLEIAQCEGKGQVYFTSPYLFLTSNFDLKFRTPELATYMTEPEALERRMDMVVEVHKADYTECQRFDRSKMRFTIQPHRDAEQRYVSWYGLVDAMVRQIVEQYNLSSAINAENLSDYDRDQLERVKQHHLGNPISLDDVPSDPQPTKYVSSDEKKKNRNQKEEKPEAGSFAEYCKKYPVIGHTIVKANSTWDDVLDTVRTWTEIPEPSRMERVIYKYRDWLPSSMTRPVEQHIQFYDYFAPMVKAGVIIGALCTGYVMFKSLKWLLTSKSEKAQGFISTSGGAQEFPKNRQKPKIQRQKAFARREFEQAGVSEMTGWQAPNGRLVEQAIYKNLCVVGRDEYRVNGLFIADHILMLPLHIFKCIEDDVISIILHGGVTIQICISEMRDEEVFIAEKNHIVFLNVVRWTRLYPCWAHIAKHFVRAEKLSETPIEWGQMFTYRSSALGSIGLLQRLMVENIAPASGAFTLKTSDGQKHLVEKSIRGRVNTIFGDCGGPWILDQQTGAKIAGIHISSEKETMTGRATLVTREMIEQVLRYFTVKVVPIMEDALEEAEQSGTFSLTEDEYYDCEETLCLDLIGQTKDYVYQPSKTNLATTIWRGISDVTKVPSRLKEFTTPEGKRIKPTVVRFKKWFGPSVRIPVDKIRAVYPYLNQWYPKPKRSERRVLTLEQAVFGEDDGVNTSIEQTTSVGWPWKRNNRRRKEFFDLETKWISDELREAVQKYLNGEHSDTVVLDSLKDERIKIEKYNKGDTRVFTICDFTLNIALKMLFGDFVHYIQKRFETCPVKLGISPLPYDWTKLYDFLTENEGGLIAGDMSGWDHRCHFEVMMGVIDWINEWYDDEYREIRYELARMTFEPLHLCDGALYRARAGMPSGSYLTTPVNSLAVLTYLYMFAQEIHGENLGDDNRLWFRPVVYGDDHVVSVAQHPLINQKTLCEWFASIGIGYTDENKNEPEHAYTTIDEVAFLKRKFVKHSGYVWGPLSQKQLYEQIQWYRRSATQRKKSQQQLSEEVLDTVLSECFMHGREKYNQMRRDFLDYAWKNANMDVSNGAPSYEVKWSQFMGHDKPPPITKLSLIPEECF
nr:MAG: RNA-dependent RNA polymerase [Wenzhou shrew picorna-like virus 5]